VVEESTKNNKEELNQIKSQMQGLSKSNIMVDAKV
jgi:hypothetical protein